MPINSVQTYLLGLLDQLPLPVPGESVNLACYITPPDPGLLDPPAAYLWPASGVEERVATPRINGPNVTTPGWKQINHRLDLYLTWAGPANDPNADVSFPAVIDAVMNALRSSPDEVKITDPVSGILSSVLLDVGENLVYEYAVVHALEDQAYLRYDCRLTVQVIEYFQS